MADLISAPMPSFRPAVMPGAELDFTVRGQTEAAQFQIIFNEASLAGAASTILAERLDVIRCDVQAEGTVITGTLPWNYRADVTVRARGAYGAREDVGSIVANAFFRAAGNMPQVENGRSIDLPKLGFSWTTALVVAGVAVLVLAWKL